VPHLGGYDRMKTGLRFLYIIPAYIVSGILEYVLFIVGFIDWLVILVTGRQSPGLQNAIVAMMGWLLRASGLLTLVTETYGFEVRTA
jgi:Domain of unknown function (DUF4389)